LAVVKDDTIIFKGNILSVDGKEKVDVEKTISIIEATDFGKAAAEYLLANGGQKIADAIRNAAK